MLLGLNQSKIPSSKRVEGVRLESLPVFRRGIVNVAKHLLEKAQLIVELMIHWRTVFLLLRLAQEGQRFEGIFLISGPRELRVSDAQIAVIRSETTHNK